MNATLRTIFERRSCRSFDGSKPVGEETLFAVLKAGAYAPSAMNRQAWHFTVVTNPEKLNALNEAVRSVLAPEDVRRICARAQDNGFHFFYGAPVFIIVSASDQAVEPVADCACALENIFLASASLGLGSCWINQLTHNSHNPAVRTQLDLLGVPAGNTVYGCAALGYPLQTSPCKDRAADTVNWVK